MKTSSVTVMFFLLITAFGVSAEQRVGGLALDFPAAFAEDKPTAAAWLSASPREVQDHIVEMRIFVAPATDEIAETRILKVRYVAQLKPSIDGAASESLKKISELNGIQNFQSSITPLVVSGLPARHVSMSADRFGGKLGGEFLIILNPSTNELWQFQLIFGKKKGLTPFASLDLSEQQLRARQIIRTVRVK